MKNHKVYLIPGMVSETARIVEKELIDEGVVAIITVMVMKIAANPR